MNKTIGIVLLTIGGLTLLPRLLRSRTVPQRPQQFPRAPDAPPPPQTNNPEDWEKWVAAIKSVYGMVSDLWEPGGPFHKGSYKNTDPAVQASLLPDRSNYA